MRDKGGHIIPKSTSIDPSGFPLILWRMNDIVNSAGDRLEDFKGFFFDSWAAGIKTMYKPTLQETITDVNWDMVVQATSFIDVAYEVLPHNTLVGIPHMLHLAPIMQHIFGRLDHCKTRYLSYLCNHFRYSITQFILISYRFDKFLHFDHLAGCATYTKDGLTSGYFGASMAQVYGKFKVPFYNHSPHQDRNGKSVQPGRLLDGKLDGFKVKLLSISVYRVFSYILLKGFLKPTLEEFGGHRFGVRLEARLALERALYTWDEWPEDLQYVYKHRMPIDFAFINLDIIDNAFKLQVPFAGWIHHHWLPSGSHTFVLCSGSQPISHHHPLQRVRHMSPMPPLHAC